MLIISFILFLSCVQTSLANSLNFLKFGQDDQLNTDYYSEIIQKSKGEPWPLPRNYYKKNKTLSVNAEKFSFKIQKYTCDILDAAFKRYYSYVFKHNDGAIEFESGMGTHQKLSELKVVLLNPCTMYPQLHSNESYVLRVTENEAELVAKEVWGVLRGLETFSHLVFKDNDQYQINETLILDHPRYPWRGLLIDTSRHFLPVPTILSVLDAMSFNKLNVLHWHIVDDQSFPFQSKLFPMLSKKGAYKIKTHEYTPSDVQKIIEHARVRGIRVMPEFDTPGHVLSWGHAIKGLLTQCYDKKGTPIKNNFGPIDPTKPKNFEFLKRFYSEVKEVFPDDYIHLGGDEVSFDCWATNPDIIAFMNNMSFGHNFELLEDFYIKKLLAIVASLEKNYLVWQEVFDNGVKLNKDTLVHVWKDGWKSEMRRVVKKGFKTILSSPWYLSSINYGASWKAYYKEQPDDFNASSEQKSLVMGGEACLWGEYVDATNIHSRLWPSASSVAERLWSSADVTDVDKAMKRLEEHRCRMIGRGINAQPPSGPGFCDDEAV